MLALALIASVHGALNFIDDDYPKALAVARSEHKPLFVDFWATWCHSCLSMQRFVLADPGMKPLADQVVWASVETETEKNKPIVEKFPVDAWPTFLLLDPDGENVLGRFLGSASVQELRAFVQDGVRAYKEKGSGDPAWVAQRQADAARIRGDLKGAADAYGRAVALSKANDPQRAERLDLYISALLRLKELRTCVHLGVKEARNVPDSAVGADFQNYAFSCAASLGKADPEARKMHQLAIARLREILAKKDAPLAVDDRSDALANLVEMLDAAGRHGEALEAMQERSRLLEKAADAAPDATMASTFDAHRVETYLYLGEPKKAEALLRQREKEMPGDYNPPARLARVLLEEKRYPEAEATVDRALSGMPRSQRRISVLELKEKILAAEKKPVDAVLREELETLRTLPAPQRRPQREAEIQGKLGTTSH